MICSGRRTFKKPDGKSSGEPGNFRRATTSMSNLKKLTDNIFTTSGETSAAQNPIPRSIRWYLGLTRTQPSLQTARDLLPGRKVDRRKYLETARSVEIEEDKKTSDKGRQGSELVSLIDKDVARTYQDIQYFKTPQVKRILKRILLVWARTCGALGYRQGMNELLAVCLLVTKTAAEEWSSSITAETKETKSRSLLPKDLCDPSALAIEADTFALFRGLMQKMSPLYHSHPRDGTQASKPEPSMGIGSGSLQTPLDRRVHRVHHVMLRRLDPKLYFALQKMQVLPQLYMLRWLRLLFTREAPLSQLLILLDAVLSSPSGFELLDFICLALVVAMRDELTTTNAKNGTNSPQDTPSIEALSALLRRNAIKNASALVDSARLLQKDKLLASPANANMLVYNAPVQHNGSRLSINGSDVVIKRAPMEGYIVGIKSQTLYWCVLEGSRLLWYAEPTRGSTVAQTSLSGCRVTECGKGILEIRAPMLPPDQTELKEDGSRLRQEPLAVQLEVKDELQYKQWLTRLTEACVLNSPQRPVWRQCFPGSIR
ncbi:hypothetical protein AAMO2058_000903700 [Amorphochlora amoebiformis]